MAESRNTGHRVEDLRKRNKTRHPGVYYRERPDGSRQYIIWYVGTDGKPRFENVPGGERGAKQARARIVDRIAHGHHVAPTKLRVSDWAKTWLEERNDIRPKTLKTYETNLKCYVLPRVGNKRVCDLNVNHVAAMISDLRKEGYRAATINGALAVLSGLMRTAVRRGFAAQNPVAQLDRGEKPKSEGRRMEILDTDEIRLVLTRASDTHRPILSTAIFTGLRMGELLSLTWDDVDWEAGVLHVRDAKTKAGVREVVLMPALKKLLATRSLEAEYPLVFHTRTGKRIDPHSLRRDGLIPALKKAEVTKHIRWHDLRHTFASILISQGHDLTYIAEQMGHSSPNITLRIYGHLFDRAKKREEARERMEAEFGEVLS